MCLRAKRTGSEAGVKIQRCLAFCCPQPQLIACSCKRDVIKRGVSNLKLHQCGLLQHAQHAVLLSV
eukprot:1160608-Pelagomonas_calceolata.AAC.6